VTIHLSILLFFPLVMGIVGGLLPRSAATVGTLVGSLVALVYAVLLLFDFETGQAGLQYVTDDAWIPELGIRYQLGIDGLNLWLVALTTLLFAASALWITLRTPSAYPASPEGTGERPKLYAFHLGLAETAVLGAFLAQDLMLFVLFFDLMLVPFYFLIGQWGGPDRVAATFKLVVYTLVGSLLMLAAAVATGVTADAGPDGGVSFSIERLANAELDTSAQRWIFAAFALAFLIKMPAFPFHGWMPDGYGNMPLPVLAVFSGVLSKVAAYGFLRVVLPVFPDAANDYQDIILLLALASILYGSAQAFTQTNLRLILGYSSIAQLGFITLGIFALGEAAGAQGALLQMVQHGLVVAPLFFIIALLYDRTGTEDIREMGGVAFRAPVLAALFLIVALATLAMPGSANFAGEFLILLGLFDAKMVIAIIAFTGVAMASVYMLRVFIRTMHNRTGGNVESRDIGVRDCLILAPLVAVVIAFGVYPQQALRDSQPTVERVVAAPAERDAVAQRQGATP
jgi:NADH-quinone oxidoreductase subunit M